MNDCTVERTGGGCNGFVPWIGSPGGGIAFIPWSG
jgi:hypothetical protein